MTAHHAFYHICNLTGQVRDPRAYQVYLQTLDGATFFGSTPERLYVRSGRNIASEAVAATRPRGLPGGSLSMWLEYIRSW